MSKIIIIKNNDGTCGIVVPAPDMFIAESKTRALVPELDGKTDEEILAWIAAKDVPEGKEYRFADLSEIPQDRYFRNAWTDEHDTSTVDINMDKARDIQMSIIRSARDAKLKELDTPALIAISRGDAEGLASIEAEKQVLRDLPGTLDLTLYATPEDLKQAIPEELQ